MKDHLSNSHAVPDADGVELPTVVQFKSQSAAVPAWVTESSQQMLQAFTCPARLEHELGRNSIWQMKHLDGRPKHELSWDEHEGIEPGMLGNVERHELPRFRRLNEQIWPEPHVEAGRIDQCGLIWADHTG